MNYRYSTNEIRYILDNADVVALVHERRYADRVAAALRGRRRRVKHVVVDRRRERADVHAARSLRRRAGRRRAASATSASAAATTSTCSTPAARPACPKGVHVAPRGRVAHARRRHRLRHRRAVDDEFEQAEKGRSPAGWSGCCLGAADPRQRAVGAADGAVRAATRRARCRNSTPARSGRPSSGARSTSIVLIGDAMARPMIEAFDDGRLRRRPRSRDLQRARRCSRRACKDEYLAALPNTVITDAIGSSETGFMGIGMITKDTEQGVGGPRVSAGNDTIVHRRVRQADPGPARRDRPDRARRAHPARLLQGPGEDRRDCSSRSTACATRSPATSPGSRRTARSRCSAAATPASTPAARRSSPKRSRRP